jgi:hypothetical protein
VIPPLCPSGMLPVSFQYAGKIYFPQLDVAPRCTGSWTPISPNRPQGSESRKCSGVLPVSFRQDQSARLPRFHKLGSGRSPSPRPRSRAPPEPCEGNHGAGTRGSLTTKVCYPSGILAECFRYFFRINVSWKPHFSYRGLF